MFSDQSLGKTKPHNIRIEGKSVDIDWFIFINCRLLRNRARRGYQELRPFAGRCTVQGEIFIPLSRTIEFDTQRIRTENSVLCGSPLKIQLQLERTRRGVQSGIVHMGNYQ
jgi:hypothetical protein